MPAGGSTRPAGQTVTVNDDGEVTTNEVSDIFEAQIQAADADIEKWLKENSDANGGMSTTDAVTLQQKMANQSIIVQTGTSTLKGIKDSILAAVRNI
ncbi:hypothetical protein [Vibrio sagamiensis]|uniref:Type III secretion protein n=1 Tax=Vibrio sagamiensis NBRC 104589 TaxID=1219064 RepID=A0A511QJF7_9VIBR|nr:hypothetical protein [Vibrio sagamiensis]GEM77463.1 hypothetical protein VSA01S_35750 [Vibrio sagamiensis NBRC 104589]